LIKEGKIMKVKKVLLLVLVFFFNQTTAQRTFFNECHEITGYDFFYLLRKNDTVKVKSILEFNRFAFLSIHPVRIDEKKYYVWYSPSSGPTKKSKMIKTDTSVLKEYLRMDSSKLYYYSDFLNLSKSKEQVFLSFSKNKSIIKQFGVAGLEGFTTELESISMIKSDSIFKFKISNFTYGTSNYPWILEYLYVSKKKGITSYVYKNGNGVRFLIKQKQNSRT
jgi:hypothetical protein